MSPRPVDFLAAFQAAAKTQRLLGTIGYGTTFAGLLSFPAPTGARFGARGRDTLVGVTRRISSSTSCRQVQRVLPVLDLSGTLISLM